VLRVNIETSYSNELFIIPDWQPDVHTDFYGGKFFDIENYANFYLCGKLCFCDEFEILEIRKASREEIEEYNQVNEIDQEGFASGISYPLTFQ
jgi:hypothetical protein